jgi:hypothetical protein
LAAVVEGLFDSRDFDVEALVRGDALLADEDPAGAATDGEFDAGGAAMRRAVVGEALFTEEIETDFTESPGVLDAETATAAYFAGTKMRFEAVIATEFVTESAEDEGPCAVISAGDAVALMVPARRTEPDFT